MSKKIAPTKSAATVAKTGIKASKIADNRNLGAKLAFLVL
jgi:hypothetical protein